MIYVTVDRQSGPKLGLCHIHFTVATGDNIYFLIGKIQNPMHDCIIVCYYLLNYALNLHKYSIIYTYIQHIYIYPVFPFNGLVGWKKCFKLMMTNARFIRPGVVLYSLNTSRVTFFDLLLRIR